MTTRQYLFTHFISKGKSAKQAALAAGYKLLCLQQNLQRLLGCPKVQQVMAQRTSETNQARANYQAVVKMCLSIIGKATATDASRLEASKQLMNAQKALEKLGPEVEVRVGVGAEMLDEWPEWRDIEPSPHDVVAQELRIAEKDKMRHEKALAKKAGKITNEPIAMPERQE